RRFFAWCLSSVSVVRPNPIEIVYEWTKLTYDLKGLQGLDSKSHWAEYKADNNALGEVRHYKDKLYLAVPRWKDGVPSTLNSIDMGTHPLGSSPNLEPFPNIFKNEIGLCSSLQNVATLEVTPKGHLWVADTGSVAIFMNAIRKCPAKLMVFDLEAGNAEVFSYEFPESVVSTQGKHSNAHGSRLLQESEGTENTDGLDESQISDDIFQGLFVYMSDISSGHVVVFDAQRRKSWPVLVPAMKPSYVTLMFQRQTVGMNFGTMGIALESKASSPAETRLFFGTLGKDLFAISVAHLRNAITPNNRNPEAYVSKIGKKRAATEGIIADDQGVLYYSLLETGTIMQWNTTETPFYHKREEILKNDAELEWVNSLSVDDGSLWIVSNRFHRFAWFELSSNESNFKIFRFRLPRVNDVKPMSYVCEYISDSSRVLANIILILVVLNVVKESFFRVKYS
ncbi:LOW QUALITY PROTEIN: protein yellow-like, partial [Tigriopus californicus]|uniref:LOW QUALITY PROTEIN: protein yellow-like n=1 Tax=Tigriopus californicus TaxID=6832 RepID=UPI0027DA58E9